MLLHGFKLSPDSQPGDGGQEPPTPSQDGGVDYKAELEKVRGEAAARRVKAKELEAELAKLKPLADKAQALEDANKSETEKLAAKIADFQAQLGQAQEATKRAEKERRLALLAAKANVPAELIPYLNADKFDFEDEDAALKALQSFGKANSAGGSPSSPARSGAQGKDDPAEWYKNITGKRPTIFGG